MYCSSRVYFCVFIIGTFPPRPLPPAKLQVALGKKGNGQTPTSLSVYHKMLYKIISPIVILVAAVILYSIKVVAA